VSSGRGDYVHGYHAREGERLRDQAGALADLLHHDTAYPPGSAVLEAGCGTGAQTVTLLRHSPGARLVAVDVSAASLAEAQARVEAAGLTGVEFLQADIFSLPFATGSFDHVFVCFVLEHLSRPLDALRLLGGLLRPGGTITVIEGDHGSAYFHPDSAAARDAIACQVELQHRAGGDAMIGRRVYPLLVEAGFREAHVTPRVVYADAGRPGLVEAFTRRTFTAMIEGVRESALAAGLTEADAFDRGIRDLYRTAAPDGTFSYTFFKGVAVRGAGPAAAPEEDVLLHAARLRMRRLGASDLALLERVFCDTVMMRHLGTPWTREFTEETLDEWRREWGRDAYYYGVLETVEEDVPVGIAGISVDTVPGEPGVELAWFVVPEHQGRGYATETGEALMGLVFGRLGRERMLAETHPDNAAAAAVLRKMGWRCVGEKRRHIDYLPGMDRQAVWECRREEWQRRAAGTAAGSG
jgi:RimJ/RimL family protein N-acetyltransferase/trans-aconitate methyltransferase